MHKGHSGALHTAVAAVHAAITCMRAQLLHPCLTEVEGRKQTVPLFLHDGRMESASGLTPAGRRTTLQQCILRTG